MSTASKRKQFTLGHSRTGTLSPAESRVLAALCEGRSLAEIASDRVTSVTAIRAQLDSIYRKTGTMRHAELVSQTLKNPPLFG